MNIYIGEPIVISDMQGPCSDGFHVPLKEELEGIQTIMSGLGLSSIDNYKTYLHLPFAGCRQYSDGSATDQNGNYAHYWTSSRMSNEMRAYEWFLNYVGSDSVSYQYTGYGCSIRPYKNTPVVPDSSWTALYSDKIYYNATLGLISLSSNGTTWVTIADKNLGATTVYNYGDAFSEDNCGKYYQRGNNYAFPRSGSVTTSSTQVNASTYGPGNYYESSTFITSYNWESSDNKNLRGGTSQGTSNKPIEVQNIYIGDYVPPYEGPLRFTANTAGSTIKLQKNGSPTSVTLETSTDGSTWTTYTFGTTITLSNIGDKVSFRNTSTSDTGFSTAYNNYYQFVMTGSISAEGDTNYLLNKNSTKTASDYCFYQLFDSCKSLTTAPQLPATTLGNYCYSSMFWNCQNLTTATSLPATTLKQYCYTSMFSNCPNLEQIPALPATTLTVNCYNSMFTSCQKIKVSTTQTGEYQTPYRIPTEGTGTTSTNSLNGMFSSTGGSMNSTPSINTTYYTSNTIV